MQTKFRRFAINRRWVHCAKPEVPAPAANTPGEVRSLNVKSRALV